MNFNASIRSPQKVFKISSRFVKIIEMFQNEAKTIFCKKKYNIVCICYPIEVIQKEKQTITDF